MNFQTINASASPEVQENENWETIDYASVYGKRQPVTTGLTWGYYGGRWGGFAVTASTFTLTDDSANYIVAKRADGVTSCAATSTNWDDTAAYARVYKLTTASGVVTATEDHRAGPYGVFGETPGTGRQAIRVMANQITPSASGGCAALATIASAANQPDIQTLDFDTTTQEYAQFSIPMPKRWNEGTVTFKPIWSHAATTVNFGVVWDLQALALSNDDAIAQAFGTAATSTDTGGTTDDLYVGPESAAITVAGTPAAEDVVFFRLSRVTGDGGDTLAVDARLHGIVLYITTDAENDA
jgi:hypothetical protein